MPASMIFPDNPEGGTVPGTPYWKGNWEQQFKAFGLALQRKWGYVGLSGSAYNN